MAQTFPRPLVLVDRSGTARSLLVAPAGSTAGTHSPQGSLRGRHSDIVLPAFHAHEPAAYFADARADDDKVVLGGWEAISGRPTDQCRWYSFEIKLQDAPWFFPGGRPSRAIAALELLATVACVVLFGPPSQMSEGRR